jgi:hypothetical protein
MPEYTMVKGTDYEDALRRLLVHWRPDRRMRIRATDMALIPLDDEGNPTGPPHRLELTTPADVEVWVDRDDPT